jgi:hypothetical protein
MGQKLHKFISKLEGINRNAHFKLINIVNQNRRLIEDANRERLADGKLSDGTSIINNRSGESTFGTNRYSKYWAEKRQNRGRQVEYVDLKYTGNFYKSIKYKKTEDGGKIISTDSDQKKLNDIDDRYGDKVLGLTENELDNIAKDAAIQLSEFIAQKISD